jgi:hypothetical protein
VKREAGRRKKDEGTKKLNKENDTLGILDFEIWILWIAD